MTSFDAADRGAPAGTAALPRTPQTDEDGTDLWCAECGVNNCDGACQRDEEGAVQATDAEPPVGTVVRDAEGHLWWRFDDSSRSWAPLTQHWEPEDDDPETWTRVAGNYGPVVIVKRHDCAYSETPGWCSTVRDDEGRIWCASCPTVLNQAPAIGSSGDQS